MQTSKYLNFAVTVFREAIHCFSASGSCCRFEPCCSNYAKSAFQYYNFGTASWLILKRLVRCQRFGTYGYDPLPKTQGVESGF